MKNSILIIFLLFGLNKLYSQKSDIKIYMYNPCKDSTYLHNYIKLRDKNDSSFYYDCRKGQMIDTGEYYLFLVEIGELKIRLADNYTYIDTLYYPKITEIAGFGPGGGYYGYYDCDNPCNGQLVDYYKKGVKRIEGEFKNGMPIGQFKYYYPTGGLQEIRTYSRSSNKLKGTVYYDLNGNVKKVEKKGYKIKISKPSVPIEL